VPTQSIVDQTEPGISEGALRSQAYMVLQTTPVYSTLKERYGDERLDHWDNFSLEKINEIESDLGIKTFDVEVSPLMCPNDKEYDKIYKRDQTPQLFQPRPDVGPMISEHSGAQHSRFSGKQYISSCGEGTRHSHGISGKGTRGLRMPQINKFVGNLQPGRIIMVHRVFKNERNRVTGYYATGYSESEGDKGAPKLVTGYIKYWTPPPFQDDYTEGVSYKAAEKTGPILVPTLDYDDFAASQARREFTASDHLADDWMRKLKDQLSPGRELFELQQGMVTEYDKKGMSKFKVADKFVDAIKSHKHDDGSGARNYLEKKIDRIVLVDNDPGYEAKGAPIPFRTLDMHWDSFSDEGADTFARRVFRAGLEGLGGSGPNSMKLLTSKSRISDEGWQPWRWKAGGSSPGSHDDEEKAIHDAWFIQMADEWNMLNSSGQPAMSLRYALDYNDVTHGPYAKRATFGGAEHFTGLKQGALRLPGLKQDPYGDIYREVLAHAAFDSKLKNEREHSNPSMIPWGSGLNGHEPVSTARGLDEWAVLFTFMNCTKCRKAGFRPHFEQRAKKYMLGQVRAVARDKHDFHDTDAPPPDMPPEADDAPLPDMPLEADEEIETVVKETHIEAVTGAKAEADAKAPASVEKVGDAEALKLPLQISKRKGNTARADQIKNIIDQTGRTASPSADADNPVAFMRARGKRAPLSVTEKAALRAELSGMKVRALTRRAEEVGVDDEKLDQAEGVEDLIALIVTASAGQPEPVPDAAATEPAPDAAATDRRARNAARDAQMFEAAWARSAAKIAARHEGK
jgi:hypothetical protein